MVESSADSMNSNELNSITPFLLLKYYLLLPVLNISFCLINNASIRPCTKEEARNIGTPSTSSMRTASSNGKVLGKCDNSIGKLVVIAFVLKYTVQMIVSLFNLHTVKLYKNCWNFYLKTNFFHLIHVNWKLKPSRLTKPQRIF